MINSRIKLNRIALLALPVVVVTMGSNCMMGGPFPTDTVAVVFVNNAGFEVDPTVDGERMETVIPGRVTRPVLFDCRPGERFDFSGSVRTNTQTLPSPYDVTFDESQNFACGQTIQITYVLNNNNDLDLDGISY